VAGGGNPAAVALQLWHGVIEWGGNPAQAVHGNAPWGNRGGRELAAKSTSGSRLGHDDKASLSISTSLLVPLSPARRADGELEKPTRPAAEG
jgi:hypothetical protein